MDARSSREVAMRMKHTCEKESSHTLMLIYHYMMMMPIHKDKRGQGGEEPSGWLKWYRLGARGCNAKRAQLAIARCSIVAPSLPQTVPVHREGNNYD
ncbi:hypothetical protein CEXT_192151 [Caerostris extrusa]|uniref:Uncharacterized protein n=1 Tax=Caerostris extrusa TaxID=172846 RepID=A0AAV4P2B2_CAEEX|nr:hypothetical protein CEXT_192151 [Caerostris extrusa]